MKYRKLRIAFSAVCGIICLLLIVLWVRSYSGGYEGWHTLTRVGNIWVFFYESFEGGVRIRMFNVGTANIAAANWDRGAVAIPYWMFVIVLGTLAALPWIKWRFSLRTLLIAMTLIAAGLGLIVALNR